MLHRRDRTARAHTKAQGFQALEDTHLPILRQIVYAGNVPVQAHAKACRTTGQTAIDCDRPQFGRHEP